MQLQRLLLLFVLGFFALDCAAEERLAILKVGTEVYTNVTVTSVTATDIYFTHSRGMANAKLRDLDPGARQHFHFDPAAAAARQAEQIESNAAYTKAVREAPPVKRQVVSPDPGHAPPPVEDLIPRHRLYAKSFLGQPAPELTVAKWLTDAPDTHGKFVLVDFWATWCGPCRRSIPELNEFHARFKDRLVVIGLSEESEQAVRAMKEPRMDYAVAIDPQGRTSKTVEVKGIPHTMLIDPKGIVRFEGMPGYLTAQLLEKLLAKYSL